MTFAADIASAIPAAELRGVNQDVLRPAELDVVASEPRTLGWLRPGIDVRPMAQVQGVLICDQDYPGHLVRSRIITLRPRLGLALALQAFWPDTELVVRWKGGGHEVHPTAIIGQQGNSVERDADGFLVRIPPQAGVVIWGDVYVGAFVTIVRGVLSDTVIGEGSEICNHVNVGHGARIGSHCVLAPFAAIGGSSRIGDRVVIWQGARVRNGIAIGDDAVIGQGANVVCDVPPGETWVGNPAKRKD